MTRPMNIAEYEAAAREVMSQMAYDYYAGGALDEVTLAAPTIVWDVEDGQVRRSMFDPRSAGFEYASSREIQGGDDAAEAKWHDLKKLPKLAFDHDVIIRDFIKWNK